jgi:Putative Actinobacterial Holin-X, holin superfamily III
MSNISRSVPEIVSDVFSQFTALMRKEGQLARAEVSENIAIVGKGLGMIVGAAVLLIPALVILLQAGVAALTENYGFAPYWSSLIVGGVSLIVGLIMASIGNSRLKTENIMPKRTVHQLQQDASVAKQQVRPNHDLRRAA